MPRRVTIEQSRAEGRARATGPVAAAPPEESDAPASAVAEGDDLAVPHVSEEE